MLRIQTKIAKWSKKQFPYQTALSKMIHLEKEILELKDEIVNSAFKMTPNVPVEIADNIILLLGIADIYGVDALKEVKKKHKINVKRKWNNPDKDGVSYHVKESD